MRARLFLPLLAAAAFAGWNASAFCADAAPDAAATDQAERPAIQFHVLQQKRVPLGDRSLYLNRVAPPVLPPAVPPAVPVARELTAEELEIVRRREGKRYELLFVSATVYDREVTELRWWGNGAEHRAFSNIDFHHLAGMGEIETADTVYGLLLGIGDATRSEVDEWNQFVTEKGLSVPMKAAVPTTSDFPAGRASYILTKEPSSTAAASAGTENGNPLAAMDALHLYYDTNRLQLAEASVRREREQAERERWLKENPPVPKDTVINYWFSEGGNGTRVLDRRSVIGGRP